MSAFGTFPFGMLRSLIPRLAEFHMVFQFNEFADLKPGGPSTRYAPSPSSNKIDTDLESNFQLAAQDSSDPRDSLLQLWWRHGRRRFLQVDAGYWASFR